MQRIACVFFIALLTVSSTNADQPIGRPTRSTPTAPANPAPPFGRPTRSNPTAGETGHPATKPSGAISFTATKIKKIDDHSSSIFDLVATPTGGKLLSVGTDGMVFMYETASWKQIAKSDAPEKKSLGVRLSPDGKFAFTASDPNEVLIYNMPDLSLLHRVKFDHRTTNISCSSALPMVAVGGHSGSVKLVGVSNGKVVREVPVCDDNNRVLFSPDGQTLYVSGKNGEKFELYKWSFRERIPSRVCELPGECYELKWGKTASELCATGAENAVLVNVNTGEITQQWKSPDAKIVADFSYWKQHDVYLTGTKGGNVHFWKRGQATPVYTLAASTAQVHHVVPIGDDQLAVALQQSGNSLAIFEVRWKTADIASVDPKTPTEPKDPSNPPTTPTDPTAPVEDPVAKIPEAIPVQSFTIDTPFSRTLAFNSKGAVLAVALDHAEMAFFNPTTGKEIGARLHNDNRGHYVSQVQPHRDSGVFVLQESYGAMSFYDYKRSKRLRPGGSGGVTGAIAWSPDRKLIFSGTQSGFDIASFDLSKRHSTLTIEGVTSVNGSLARGLTVGPKNVVAMMRADGKLQWFNHTQELSFEHDSIVSAHKGGLDVRFINGQYASIGNEGNIKFWKQGDETPTRTISLGGKVREARFLTDSLVLVLRDGESKVELHTIDNAIDESNLRVTLPIDAALHEQQYVRPYERVLHRVAISPNGKMLAALSKDGDQTRVSIYDTGNLTGSSSSSSGGDATAKPPTLASTKKIPLATPFIRSLDFNSNGGALAVATENELLFLNARTGKTVSKAEPPAKSGDVFRFVYPHIDPSVFFANAGKNVISLIDARTGKKVQTKETHELSCRARWTGDGKWLAFTHVQGGSLVSADFKHIDGLTNTTVKLSDDDAIGNGIAVSPRGDLAAIVRVDGELLIFRQVAERRWELQSKSSAHSGSATDVVFMGDMLATIGNEGEIKYWKVGETEPTHSISLGGELADARFINNNLVAVAREDANELEFHMLDFKEETSYFAAVIPFDGRYQTSGGDKFFERPCNRMALARDGKTLVACSTVGDETELAFYDIRSMKRRSSHEPTTELKYRNWTSADGQYKIEAALLGVTDGVAKLKRKSDGIVVSVPLSKLTKADQAFAKATAPE